MACANKEFDNRFFESFRIVSFASTRTLLRGAGER